MQCHVWRFEHGSDVAALLLSGPFGAASLVAPLLSATLLEGSRDAEFAISIAGLFEQARAAAYVPEPDFEAAYAKVSPLFSNAMNFLSLEMSPKSSPVSSL